MASKLLLMSVPFSPRTMAGISARAPIAATCPVFTAKRQAAATLGPMEPAGKLCFEMAAGLALWMAFAQLGDTANAAASVAEILKVDPNYGDHIEADLAKRGISPHFIRATIEGLSKAGMHIPAVAQGNDLR